jgi:uncharacterized protein YqeY
VSDQLREQLRKALPAAMKARDRVAVGVLRSTLAAIDNAEAVVPAETTGLAIEHSSLGVGASEAERRFLSPDDIARIVRDEASSREDAAADYDRVGHPDRAAQLRDEARYLTAFL